MRADGDDGKNSGLCEHHITCVGYNHTAHVHTLPPENERVDYGDGEEKTHDEYVGRDGTYDVTVVPLDPHTEDSQR